MAALLSQITAFLPVFLASPTAYAGILLIVTSPDHPKARTFAALVGSLLAIIVIGFIALAAGGAASGPPRQPSTASAVIDLLLGVFLIYAGIKRAVKKPKNEPEKAKSENGSTELQFLKYVGFGILLTITNPTSLASFLASAKLTLDSGLNTLQQTAAMAVAGFYFTLPILWPLVILIAAPSSSERVLTDVNRILKQYGRYIVAVIAFLLGIYLMAKGMRIPA